MLILTTLFILGALAIIIFLGEFVMPILVILVCLPVVISLGIVEIIKKAYNFIRGNDNA